MVGCAVRLMVRVRFSMSWVSGGRAAGVGACVVDLLDTEGFLVTLGQARGELFCDADRFDALYASGRGRPSRIRRRVVAALLLLQLFYGVSGPRGAAPFAVPWQTALGLPLAASGDRHVVLVEFRARLVRAGPPPVGPFWGTGQVSEPNAVAGPIGNRRTMDSPVRGGLASGHDLAECCPSPQTCLAGAGGDRRRGRGVAGGAAVVA